jgi:flagellar biogenesis protein FliO
VSSAVCHPNQVHRLTFNPALEKGNKGSKMLWVLFMILLLAWLLGIAGGHTLGSFIHLLLVLAFITAVTKLVQDRREDPVTIDTKI